MKFCKDCVFFAPEGKKRLFSGYSENAIRFGKCNHGTSRDDCAPDFFAASGKTYHVGYRYAAVMRCGHLPTYCGPDAKWFQPINQEKQA